MVKNIRTAESCLGIKKSKTTTSEENFLKATRSVVSSKLILKGEVISADNITTKRPFLDNCVSAKKFYEVQNCYVAKNDIKEDQIINWDDIARVES